MLEKYDPAKIPMGMDNIFGLSNSQNFTCQVIRYSPSHSILSIEVIGINTNDIYVIHFENVRFFEGTFYWSSANFCTSTVDDYSRILYSIANKTEEIDNKFRESLLTQSERLFVVRLPTRSIKIVASAITTEHTNFDKK